MARKPTYEELEQKYKTLENEILELKQAQKQLQDSEARYRDLLEQSNLAMFDMVESISDGFIGLNDQFVVTYFNSTAKRILGRQGWEVLGHNFFKAFPEFKGSIFEDKLTAVMNEQNPLSFEIHFDVKPYVNWYEVRVYPQSDGISVYFQVATGPKLVKPK